MVLLVYEKQQSLKSLKRFNKGVEMIKHSTRRLLVMTSHANVVIWLAYEYNMTSIFSLMYQCTIYTYKEAPLPMARIKMVYKILYYWWESKVQ